MSELVPLILLSIMFIFNFTFCNSNKIGLRIYTASVLSILGILCGLVPEVQERSLSVSAIAYAQEYTNDEVLNYAKAGYKVELLRRQIYKEIKMIVNEPPPNIVCNQEQTLENLSGDVREIAERYCNESRQIVQDHNLTINRFNELKTRYDRGEKFYQQVQNVLIDLQRP